MIHSPVMFPRRLRRGRIEAGGALNLPPAIRACFHGDYAVAELKHDIRDGMQAAVVSFHGDYAVTELKPAARTTAARASTRFHGDYAVAELKPGCRRVRRPAHRRFHGDYAVAELKLDTVTESFPSALVSTATTPWPN